MNRLAHFAALLVLFAPLRAAEPPTAVAAGSRLFSASGVPLDENFFPLGVWMQDPRHAARYQAAGINLYVALWQGPTAEQLRALEMARMPVICRQTPLGLENKANPIIAAWMHEDEPDNAQSLGPGRGFGPPVLPEVIRSDYQRYRNADPSRPVFLNLTAAVAWDNYRARGVRRNHPEDYPAYLEGCDIASFDIYPVVHTSPEVAGKLELVGYGVRRLLDWSGGKKPVWNCIECTHIKNPNAKATPEQVRSQVWLALISGSRGLIYFVHEFQPAFREAAVLEDPVMLAAITAINRQIRALAPVLNSPTLPDTVTVEVTAPATAALTMVKRHRDATYLFAVNPTNQPARMTFSLRHPTPDTTAEVLGESREVRIQAGRFTADFRPYQVQLYRIAERHSP